MCRSFRFIDRFSLISCSFCWFFLFAGPSAVAVDFVAHEKRTVIYLITNCFTSQFRLDDSLALPIFYSCISAADGGGSLGGGRCKLIREQTKTHAIRPVRKQKLKKTEKIEGNEINRKSNLKKWQFVKKPKTKKVDSIRFSLVDPFSTTLFGQQQRLTWQTVSRPAFTWH